MSFVICSGSILEQNVIRDTDVFRVATMLTYIAKPPAQRGMMNRLFTRGVYSLISMLGLSLMAFLTASHLVYSHSVRELDSLVADVATLRSGEPIQKEIAKGESHLYRIRLDRKQYMQIAINQESIGLAVVLFDPEGKKISEISNPGLIPDQETISLIAQIPGEYRLQVRPVGEGPATGRYELEIKETRTATPQDRESIAAERAFSEGDTLRAEWRKDSLLEAINRYEKAQSFWRTTGNQQKQAKALRNIGNVYSTLGKRQEALNHYDQALQLSRAIGNSYLEVELLNRISSIYIDWGKLAQARNYCQQALTISQKINYFGGEGWALNNLGLTHYSQSDMRAALDLFAQSLEVCQRANDTQGQAEAINNLGYVYNDLGEIRQAQDHFYRALSLWQKANDRQGQAITLSAIGSIYTLLGEYQKALDFHTQAERLFREIGDLSGQALSFNGVGYLYEGLGEKEKALEYYSEALTLWRTTGARSREALTIGYIGRIYSSSGENQRALAYFQQKLVISLVLGDLRMEADSLKEIGEVYSFLGNQQTALNYYSKALALSRQADDRRAQAYILNNIGFIHYEQDEKSKSLGLYEEALVLIRDVGDRVGERQVRYNIARVNRDLGNLNEARKEIDSVLSMIEHSRAKILRQDLRASYFASVRQYYELYIDILMHLWRQDPKPEYIAAALEVSERARGRVLLDMLNETHIDIRQGVDPVLLEQEHDLQQMLNAKAERQIRLLNGVHTEEQATAIKKEIADLTSQYQEILTRIRATSPRYADLTQPRILNPSEIQRQLDTDTLLLQYSLGDERSYLWAVTQNSLSAFVLPSRSEIEKAANYLYKLLTSLNQFVVGESSQQRQVRLKQASIQYSEMAARLSQIILGPITPLLGTKRLVIVGDGALHYIPFAALPAPTKNSEELQEPLLVKHEIVSLPSSSALALLRSELAERNAATKTVAVLADPVFERSDPRVRFSSESNKMIEQPYTRSVNSASISNSLRSVKDRNEALDQFSFHRLPFSRLEAEAIVSLVPENQRMLALDFDANLAKVKSSELGQYRIIHLATHGLLDSSHPELSSIVLSLVDQQGRPRNGFLRSNEIYNLKLSAELVVLSGCSTALGKEIKGEGLVGITRSFMYAGAQRVAVSLWAVDDRATAELMKYFYEAMLGPQKLRPAAALRAAQLKMWAQKQWQSPYFWAAFILEGDWK